MQYGDGSVSITLNSTALIPPRTRNISPLWSGRYASRKYGFRYASNRLLSYHRLMSTHYDTIRSRCARAQKYSTDADYANKTSSSAMAERPCSCGHCGMLCLCPKSSLCSCRQLLYVRLALRGTCLFMPQGWLFSKRVGRFRQIFDREGGVSHQSLLVSENYSNCRFMWYQTIRSASFSFVTIHTSDRRTDRQNCITCSRKVNTDFRQARWLVIIMVLSASFGMQCNWGIYWNRLAPACCSSVSFPPYCFPCTKRIPASSSYQTALACEVLTSGILQFVSNCLWKNRTT